MLQPPLKGGRGTLPHKGIPALQGGPGNHHLPKDWCVAAFTAAASPCKRFSYAYAAADRFVCCDPQPEPAPQAAFAAAPAPAPAPDYSYDYGDDDDGPVADDV